MSHEPHAAWKHFETVEERMRSIVDHVLDGIITIDTQGVVLSFNPAAERLFGYTQGEVIGRNVSMLMPGPYREQHDGYLRNYLTTGEARIIGTGREVVGLRRDGSTFPMELAVSEFHIGTARHFTGIVRDITERKRLEEELRRRLSDLAEADRHKNEFLAMLGHELRNPLAPMRNALHILAMDSAPPEVSRRARDIIDRQLHHLVRLVDDLLDVSRIVRGKVELQRQRVDLRDAVQRACETAQPVVDAHGHELVLELPGEPLWVEGDPVRLSQVLANLLTNAAKYTPHAGLITLRAAREAEYALVHVRDTGSGIPADLLPRIFDLFVQGDRTPERAQGGLGIGLTLVRKLVELHGGTVAVHSEGAGRGSEFTVALPALPAASDAELVPAGPAVEPGSPRKVLVVDDNVDACESVAMILAAFGYRVRCLFDGPSVLPAAMEWSPDAVVLDIGLPGMSGLEVAVQLRRQPQFAAVPLAALTGYGQDEDLRRSRAAGFDLHLTKPADPHVLHAWLARSFAGAGPLH